MITEDLARVQAKTSSLHIDMLGANEAERLRIQQQLLRNDHEMAALLQQLLAIYADAAREAHGGSTDG